MKGRINKDGNLEIERAGKYKVQYCPHEPDIKANVACGDWCPLFDTFRLFDNNQVVPLFYTFRLFDNNQAVPLWTPLPICDNTTLMFDTLIDERDHHE